MADRRRPGIPPNPLALVDAGLSGKIVGGIVGPGYRNLQLGPGKVSKPMPVTAQKRPDQAGAGWRLTAVPDETGNRHRCGEPMRVQHK
jgi:hypothetical protein